MTDLLGNTPLIGAFTDFLVYLFLTWFGFSAAYAHVVSFFCAAVFYYGFSFSFRAILKDEQKWNLSQILYVIGFACMVLSIRGGIVYLGAIATELHPVLSFLPALLITLLSNLLYIRFVQVGAVNAL